MSSLSRILRLARQSDTPVVIYDTDSDTDFVLMRGEAYDEVSDIPFSGINPWDDEWHDHTAPWEYDDDEEEDDILDHWYSAERRALIADMSGADLLDQINRDIAVWRAKEKQEAEETTVDILAHELTAAPPFDPFTEDVLPQSEWHTPADVLKEYSLGVPPPVSLESPSYTSSGYTSPDTFTGMRPDKPVALEWDQAESGGEWSPLYPLETIPPREAIPIQIEEEPFDPPLVDTLVEQEPLPDDDAPVFYDEPRVLDY